MVVKFKHDKIKVSVNGVEAKVVLQGSLNLSFNEKAYLESDDRKFDIGIYIPRVKVIPEEKEALRKRIVEILTCCPNHLGDVLNEEMSFILKKSLESLKTREVNKVEEKSTKIKRFIFGYENKTLESENRVNKIIVKLNSVIGHMGYVKNVHYEEKIKETLWEPLFIDFEKCDLDVKVILKGNQEKVIKIKNAQNIIEECFKQAAVKGEFPYDKKFPEFLILEAIVDKVEELLEGYEEKIN